MPAKKPTIALVLGSGGARGYAHVGVIEVLLERGFEIVAIAGCSMGALVGGIYAAGKLKEFKDWATGLGQFDVLRLLDISLSSSGAIRGEKVFSVVRELIGDTKIEDLPVAYTAVATDLLRHKEIWFQEGPLHKAIRASIAIPSLITPVLYGNRVLVDGGLLNPLPIIPTIAAHADYIVAVNLSYYDEKSEILQFMPVREKTNGGGLDEWMNGLMQKAVQLFERDTDNAWNTNKAEAEMALEGDAPETVETELAEAPPEKKPEAGSPEVELQHLDIGKFDIMNLAFETMQSSLTQYKLAGYPPDILINIPKGVCKTFDYHKAPELIQIGRRIAQETLDKLIAEGNLKLE